MQRGGGQMDRTTGGRTAAGDWWEHTSTVLLPWDHSVITAKPVRGQQDGASKQHPETPVQLEKLPHAATLV